jgi:hypothetical protein
MCIYHIYIIFRSYIKSHTHIYISYKNISYITYQISHIKNHISQIMYHISYHITYTHIYIYTYYIISYIIYHHIFHVISQSFAVEVRTSFTSFRAPRPLWPWPWPPATVNQLGVVLSPPIRDGLTDWHWKNDTWNILKYEYPLVN